MSMIKRDIGTELALLLKEYPVVALLGPRQSGKTTLAQSIPGYRYCNLELPENREFAAHDPKAFLRQFAQEPVVFDEIQRTPHLLSYLQAIVDSRKINGQFILTGSHQLELKAAVTQSLAGRVGILHLLPFSMSELTHAEIQFDRFEEYAYRGFLPRVYDQHQRPTQAYSNYYQTYVERDVRQLINLKDTTLFEKFMKLLAGRTGQLINYNSLAGDVGVDAKTIKHWLAILEASFIVFKLPPYFNNFGKRLIKSPKYYFVETGLLTFLLGIEKPEQLTRDPLVGAVFENLVVMDCLKSQYNRGKMANLYFYRDSSGLEIDLLNQREQGFVALECKSGSTFSLSLFGGLEKFSKLIPHLHHAYVVYNGDTKQLSDNKTAMRFDGVGEIFE